MQDDWRGEALIRGRRPDEKERRATNTSLANYIGRQNAKKDPQESEGRRIHKRMMQGVFIDLMKGRGLDE